MSSISSMSDIAPSSSFCAMILVLGASQPETRKAATRKKRQNLLNSFKKTFSPP